MASLIRIKDTFINLDYVVLIKRSTPKNGGLFEITFADGETLLIPADLLSDFLKALDFYVPQVSEHNDSSEIKILLLKKGLSVSEVARQSGTRRDMMIHGVRYYPTLAKRLHQRYGITIMRQPTSEKKAA